MLGCVVVALLFVPASTRNKIIPPVELDGVVDERVTYVPLGYNQMFDCEAKSTVNFLVRSRPLWRVLFYNPENNTMDTFNITSIRNNERFHQLDNSSLFVTGIQRWHNEAVMECVVETGPSSSVISRHIVVVQDCDDKKTDNNPCLYGKCGVGGIEGVYEIVHCNCTAQYTGDFCSDPAVNLLLEEAINHAPLLFLLFFIVIIVCTRKKIEFGGKYKPMRMQRQISAFNSLPSTMARYPAAYLPVDKTAEGLMEELPAKEPDKQFFGEEEKSRSRTQKEAISSS